MATGGDDDDDDDDDDESCCKDNSLELRYSGRLFSVTKKLMRAYTFIHKDGITYGRGIHMYIRVGKYICTFRLRFYT